MQYELGFIGAGNMAEAIARAAIDNAVLSPAQLIAADPVAERRDVFTTLGAAASESNADVINQSKQVLMAVKPQMMPQTVADLSANLRDEQVLLTIMAGITTTKLSQVIGRPVRVVRIMPNTPLQIGVGMSAIAMGEHAGAGDDDLAMRLFGAGGAAIRVDEPAIDVVTAVSGSGPAYVFYLAEAMMRAAEELGLGEHAALLAQQTICGAAELMKRSEHGPAELRRRVTSRAGTTEAAIRHMDEHRVADVIVQAIKKAHARSIELGK